MGCDDRFYWRKRLEAMRLKPAKTPLAAFKADCALSICVVMNPAIVACNGDHVDSALDRPEAFFRKRGRRAAKRRASGS